MSISIFNLISKQKEATVSGSNLISICKEMSFLQSNQLTAISVLNQPDQLQRFNFVFLQNNQRENSSLKKTGSRGEGSDTLIPLPFTTKESYESNFLLKALNPMWIMTIEKAWKGVDVNLGHVIEGNVSIDDY